MSYLTLEHRFVCPYCWEQITMLLDLSASGQTYVEDCEVCCNPINVVFGVLANDLNYFEARRMD